LFVGLSINYLKVAPAMSISFVAYDALSRLLQVAVQTASARRLD